MIPSFEIIESGSCKWIGPWRRCFAWLPTKVFDGHRVWLCAIWKRRYQRKPNHSGPVKYRWAVTDFPPAPDAISPATESEEKPK